MFREGLRSRPNFIVHFRLVLGWKGMSGLFIQGEGPFSISDWVPDFGIKKRLCSVPSLASEAGRR